MFARLQAEIGKHAKVGIEAEKSEKIVIDRSIESKADIREMTNKPKSVIWSIYCQMKYGTKTPLS